MTTLRQLRFLVSLADTLNFSRAAEACRVTQPTLSSGLRELELALGVQLAERTRHAVTMTPIGDAIARRARDVIADVAAIEELARAEADGATVVRLGAIPTVGPFLLPLALPRIRSARPAMGILLREDLTGPLLERLVAGDLDAVVMALPNDVPREIHVEPLFEDGYHLATPRDHPLANRPSVEGADLEGRKLLLLEPGHCLQRHALSSFENVTLAGDETFAATSLPTLVAMVEQGLGLTLLPDVAIAAGVASGGGVALTALPGARPRRIVLAWRRTSAKAALFREIGARLVEAHRILMAGVGGGGGWTAPFAGGGQEDQGSGRAP